jgi:hypothetical protein
MIELFEGNGGWTIKVKNFGKTITIGCMQYAIKDARGVTWFDLHRAMRDAEALDAAQKTKSAAPPNQED